MPPEAMAQLIKTVPLRLTAVAPIATAISTAGGVKWAEVDEHLMLRSRPGVFVAGEMLDWEAPTGGYLLQACLATGALAGRGALQWVCRPPRLTRAERACRAARTAQVEIRRSRRGALGAEHGALRLPC